jgi:hypothetical protein
MIYSIFYDISAQAFRAIAIGGAIQHIFTADLG